ncbi:acyl-CoA carboxylase epsilon subunit [Saccharothrix saharensis]|uniref:acyl-CoA carboxylase epsilon subunit n=1 Tax=Saccharothrix saharensis TaxID=571190 RepID=UPI0036BE35BD
MNHARAAISASDRPFAAPAATGASDHLPAAPAVTSASDHPSAAPAATSASDRLPAAPADRSGPAGGPEWVLRVEKGDPDPVEVAALAAVLRLRVVVVSAGEAVPRRSARWRRPERVAGFAGARTWRN